MRVIEIIMLRLCIYFQYINQGVVTIENVAFGLPRSVRMEIVMQCARGEGALSDAPNIYNYFIVDRFR